MDRKLVTGCALAFLLLIAAVGCLVLVIPKLIRKGMTAMNGVIAEEQRLSAFEKEWAPPSAAPDASWFPEKVNSWRRTTEEPSTGVPRLFIELPGWHATYRFGAEVVDVNVMPAAAADKEALFDRALSAQSGAGWVSTRMGNRASLRLGGDDYTRLWWMPKGWFFVFRNHGGADPKDFMEPYFKAMEAAPSDAPPRSEPAPALQ